MVLEARHSDWDAIRELLQAAGLPTDDLRADKLGTFLIATNHDELIGLIGLEIFGRIGLLRSLVVRQQSRSSGIGAALVSEIEARATSSGVEEMWLLTISTQDFFMRHDYLLIEKSLAPLQIRETREFSELCPDTAILMQKTLVRG